MQLELFTDETPCADRALRKRCDRLFIAVFPDCATARRIDELAQAFHREHRLYRRLQSVSRQHVSILKIGDYRRLRDQHLHAAALAARQCGVVPAFELTLDAIGSFGGAKSDRALPPRRPLVLLGRSPALAGLCAQLRLALGRRGLSPDNRECKPHLTLSYGAEMVPFQSIPVIRFTARECVLVHSEVGLTRYHLRARWPLQDPARCDAPAAPNGAPSGAPDAAPGEDPAKSLESR